MALTPRLSTGRTSDFLSGPTGIQSVTSQRILGRASGGTGASEELTLSQTLDFVGGATHGDILFRGASGWNRLPAGTAGQFLRTQGPGADPVWASTGGGGGTVGLDDGASGSPSLFFNNQPALGMFRPGADTIRWTRALNEDRVHWFFPPTSGTDTNPNLLALARVTEIWFDQNTNLPASLTGSLARIKASESDVIGFLNGGGASDYRPMSLKLYRRRDSTSDAFLKIGFATPSTTNANTLFQVVQAGATSADMQFVIPGVSTSRYLFTIGSTRVLALNSDGGHELNGSGSPNQAGVCVQNSGGPPFGRVALATMASVNGVLNLCRYGVLYSESALNNGCQFKGRGFGTNPAAADLPEEREWMLARTSEPLYSVFVKDSGVVRVVGGRDVKILASDITLTASFQTIFSWNVIAGATYVFTAYLGMDTPGGATGPFAIEFQFSGTSTGTLEAEGIGVTSDSTTSPRAAADRTTALGVNMSLQWPATDGLRIVFIVTGVFVASTSGSFDLLSRRTGVGLANAILKARSRMEMRRA